MKSSNVLAGLAGVAAVVGAGGIGPAAAQESVIHAFDHSEVNPSAPVISGPGGVLYGTTSGDYGGDDSIFRLTPPALGKTAWTETVLSRFDQAGSGYFPLGAMLLGKNGVLYGTTEAGGPNQSRTAQPAATAKPKPYDFPVTFGTVFTLAPPAPGKTQWTQTTIYDFGGPPNDGAQPFAGVIADKTGALYGTTIGGGGGNEGTVYKLTPPNLGQTSWGETVLYNFTAGTDGGGPMGPLLAGPGGVLYGTAQGGGVLPNNGNVFQLTPPAAGRTAWSFALLHTFPQGDGPPGGTLAVDSAGALYGASSGEVFKLTPPTPGHSAWTYQVLYHFTGSASGPDGGVISTSDGTLYGTTRTAGSVSASGFACGVLFMLKPPPPGGTHYAATVLHKFGATVTDACGSQATVVFGHEPTGATALYGTSLGGPAGSGGTVFRFSYSGWK